MISRDWVLAAFTILSQMAVGAFLLTWLTHLRLRRKTGEAEVRGLCLGTLLAVGPILAVGLALSLVHLSAPLNAWRTLSNVRTSWLSREILFGLLFLVMWLGSAFMELRSVGAELPDRTAYVSKQSPFLLDSFFSSLLKCRVEGVACAPRHDEEVRLWK